MPQKNSQSTTRRLNELLATSQNKSYFVGAVTVVFIVIMAMVGIIPAYSAFTFQNEENSKRDALIVKLNDKLNISQTLSKEYDEKIDLVNYFKAVFPDNPDQQYIIELLNEIVTTNSAYLDRLTFNKNSTPTFIQQGYEESIKSQQINITVLGSQASLMNVVKDLENSRRILSIINLSIDKIGQDVVEQGGATHGDYTLTLQMEYYFYSQTVSE